MRQGELARRIKESVSTRELCARLGLALDRNGTAMCPFHPDRKSRSLKVYAEPERGWHCFGCGAHGDVIDFCAKWYGITPGQAMLRLDMEFGLRLPLTRRSDRESREREADRMRQWEQERARREALVAAAEAAYWACFDRWLACWRRMWENRPKRGGDPTSAPISEEYAKALWELPIAREECDRAWDEWMRLKEGASKHGTAEATA